jgi:two-component system nitrate/nitrite response regulator NarL
VYNWAAMDQLRILLVDDHLLFRKGLAQMLSAQPDFVIVGEATDGVEAVDLAQKLEPDLVLMDINMPICNGLEATSRIKAQMPEMRVVMLTVSDDEADLADAVRRGADGYLLKDLQPEVLFDQLRRLTSGEPPISQAMTTKLFRQVAQHMAHQREQMVIQPAALGDLSTREVQVLELVANGYSNQAIADKLGIAHNTVKNHLRSILSKLGVRNRAQAAALAVSRGLLPLNTE